MIYIDNSATTRLDEEVLEAMMPYLREEYGNAGSKFYSLAKRAKTAVEEAREQVARLINAEPREIIFTASGSESNNFIIKGMADYLRHYEGAGNHLITSAVEHKSVSNVYRFLAGEIFMNKEIKDGPGGQMKKIDRGYEVDFLKVNDYGQVELEEARRAIKDNTILASFIWANNETGSLNDIEGLAEVYRERGIFVHSDATQAVGKIPVDMDRVRIDAMSFSAHKLYGPKGIGAAYLRSDGPRTRRISSLIHGGNDQESGYRAGTAAVANIVGFGKAAELAQARLEDHARKLRGLEEKFIRILHQKYADVIIVTDLENKLPGAVSFILPGVNNQLLVKRLADDLALSTGSACSVGLESAVLRELGYGQYSSNFFRVNFGKYNDQADLEKIADLI